MTPLPQSPSPASILDLWNEGYRTDQIAILLGVKEHVIYNAMSKLGHERTENRNRVIAFKSPKPE